MLASHISGTTKILGLIGDPVAQARSPAMANHLLQARDKFGDFALFPMHVSSRDLAAAVNGLRAMQNFAGAIVTMPHKNAILPLLDSTTHEAQLVGAVNVIRGNPRGELVGTVLDGEGMVGGLRDAGHSVKGKHCLLVGAGGAAAAIAFALVKYQCASLTINNRTAAKAQALAARVQSAFPEATISVSAQPAGVFDIVINGTSLGMKLGDALPVDENVVADAKLVAECVIAPEITPLLELAQGYGCAIHTGVPMLTAQMGMMLDFIGARA